MAISRKAVESKPRGEQRDLKDMYFRPTPNSSTKFVPLCVYGDIDEFGQYPFGQGSQFWTIINTNEPDDIGKMIGLKDKVKYIMPIVFYNEEEKAWSEPLFYQFPPSVYQELQLVANTGIQEKINEENSENEDNPNFVSKYNFKGSILTLVRNDKTANGFVAYSVQWNGDMWGSTKNTKGLVLPVIDELNITLGILGDTYSENMAVVRQNILNKLIEHSDYRFPDSDSGNSNFGETIGERLTKVGLSTNPNATGDEWADLELAETTE